MKLCAFLLYNLVAGTKFCEKNEKDANASEKANRDNFHFLNRQNPSFIRKSLHRELLLSYGEWFIFYTLLYYTNR